MKDEKEKIVPFDIKADPGYKSYSLRGGIVAKKGKQGDEIYTILASTDEIDRYSEVVEPTAFKGSLGPYLKKNPVILWAHDWEKAPVGKAVAGRILEHGLELDIKFADTEFAKEVKTLYDGGFLNAFSVGFIPKDHKVDEEGVWHWVDAELLETSAVPIPANPGATMIREALTKGLDLPNMKEIYLADRAADEEAESTEDDKPERKLTDAQRIKLKHNIA